jgi:hypothetical protein
MTHPLRGGREEGCETTSKHGDGASKSGCPLCSKNPANVADHIRDEHGESDES